MKKILITGSKGKIGKDLKEFLTHYYKIVEFEKNDKLSRDKFEGVHTVIHLAALTPQTAKKFTLKEYLEINAGLTKQILSYASKCRVKLIIIPTSWSWMFKVGNYQYSKLIQEKIANKYKELGLNIVIIELPEVVHNNYKGVIQSIIENIKNNRLTTVDVTNITTITTRNIANICRKFIEGNNKIAIVLYKKSLKTFNLYVYIKKIIKKRFPNKLKYIRKGQTKIITPVITKNKTIIFPDFEIE